MLFVQGLQTFVKWLDSNNKLKTFLIVAKLDL